MISAISAIANPLNVSRAVSARTARASAAARAPADARFQRSGSRTNSRTTNATAAGIRPHRKTKRHDVSGAAFRNTPAIWKFANVARNSPKGAEV